MSGVSDFNSLVCYLFLTKVTCSFDPLAEGEAGKSMQMIRPL